MIVWDRMTVCGKAHEAAPSDSRWRTSASCPQDSLADGDDRHTGLFAHHSSGHYLHRAPRRKGNPYAWLDYKFEFFLATSSGAPSGTTPAC